MLVSGSWCEFAAGIAIVEEPEAGCPLPALPPEVESPAILGSTFLLGEWVGSERWRGFVSEAMLITSRSSGGFVDVC